MTYDEIIQKAGKRIKKHVYYINNGTTINVSDESVERIKFSTQTPLIGTSINGCEITLKEEIAGDIYVTVEAKYGSSTANKTYGPFYLKETPTYDANKKTYLHKTYDKMLKSMVEYEAINITFPCTIYQYFTALVNAIGYTTNIQSLPNGNLQMTSDIFTNINYTYRDVLEDIAVANGVIFYMDGNEIKVATFDDNDPVIINDDILKNQNISFGKHFGPINVITLSRAGGSDNIYYPENLPAEIHEFKISDNQLMNDNNRSDFLPALYNQLNGIEYDIYDTELVGYGDIKPLKKVVFNTGGNTYNSYLFNQDITLTTGYKQAIYNELPEETNTDYKASDTTDKRINQTSIIVDKQNQVIESLVSKVVDISDTKKGNGSVTLENAYVGVLEKLSIKGNINLLFPQSEENMYGYPLTPSDNLVPSNTLTPSSPVPYGNEILYPGDNLFSKSSILIIDDTEYKLDFDFLNYMSESVCDEYVYEKGNCYIIRRVGIDSNGNMYALDNEVIESRNGTLLNVESNSTIRLKSFNNATYEVTYLLDNEYTSTFANQIEVESQILQTASSITEQVSAKVGDDEIIAKLNLGIKDNQGIIDIIGNQIKIKSDNFELTQDGEINSVAGKIGGWHIEENQLYCDIVPPYDYTQSDIDRIQGIILETITPTSNDYEKYDFNRDNQINAYDLLVCQKLVTYDLKNSNPGKLLFDTNDWFFPIKVINSSGQILSAFGPNGSWTREN